MADIFRMSDIFDFDELDGKMIEDICDEVSDLIHDLCREGKTEMHLAIKHSDAPSFSSYNFHTFVRDIKDDENIYDAMDIVIEASKPRF